MNKRKNKALLATITTLGILFLGLVLLPIILINKRQSTSPVNLIDLNIKKEYQEFRLAENSKQEQLNDFSGDKIPLFKIRSDISLKDFKSQVKIKNLWNGKQARLAYTVTEDGPDKVVKLEKGATFNPGAYQIKITDPKGQNLEQNFTWGVLALNLNKSAYLLKEKAEVLMTVLNDAGETECEAEINLTVISPSGKKYTLSSTGGGVIKSDECQPKNFTYKPDFKAATKTLEELGRYQLIFEAKTKNGQRKIQDSFEVGENPDFIISRQSATRIFPPSTYEMKITIAPKNDFVGEVQEIVPATFKISNHQAIIKKVDNYQVITWVTKMNKNQESVLTYNFDAPDISPEFYLLGPLRFNANKGLGLEKIFEEPRTWQMAADAVPSNIIVAWLSPTPPVGWTRDTTLDGYFLKGSAASTDPGTPGGATSHTHAVTNHSHTHTSHSHGLTFAYSNQGSSEAGNGSTNVLSGVNHGHDAASTSLANIGTEGDATGVILAAAANNSLPSYYDVLWIKSGGTTAIPANAVAYFNSTTMPNANWKVSDGNSGTPNLNGVYFRGAATAASPGGTGGSLSHSHTNTAHTHPQTNHTHTGDTGPGNPADTNQGDVRDTASITPNTHTHAVTLAANAPAPGSNTVSVSRDADNSNPPYYELAPIINTSGAADQPQNIIAMWRGTLANIPSGWILCDGTNSTPDLRDMFIRNNTSSVGNPGGSISHSHTSTGHTHVMTTHSHTGSTGNASTALKRLGSSWYPAKIAHQHAVTVANKSAGVGDLISSQTVTIQQQTNAQPPFYTVAYIQFKTNAPENCYVTRDFSTNYLTLKWSYSDANEDSFQVYRSADGAAFTSLGTAAADATSYQDTSTTISHVYAYSVRAVFGASYSTWCQTIGQDLYKSNFKFQGVRMQGIRINLLPWLERYFKTFLAFIGSLYKIAYAKVIET